MLTMLGLRRTCNRYQPCELAPKYIGVCKAQPGTPKGSASVHSSSSRDQAAALSGFSAV